MLRGINVKEVVKYVSPQDPDKDNPTVFHLGAMDPLVAAHIEDSTTEYEWGETQVVKLKMAQRNYLTVKFGLRDVERFIDPVTSLPVTFVPEKIAVNGREYLVAPESILKIMPISLLSELASVIKEQNILSGEEIKN